MTDFFVGPGSGPLAGHILSDMPGLEGRAYIDWGIAPASGAAGAAPGPQATAAVTGVNPMETSYALYGHTVPLIALGQGRVGGEIISGPHVESGLGTGINSFGVQADPTRVLTLVEMAFDSEVVWQGTCVGDPSGPVTPNASGFIVEPFTCRFYTGSLTQSADAIETSRYGANAVAYRGQPLLAVEDLPLARTKFGKYPYISCKFVDQDGAAVNFGELFERIAYSPYCGLTSSQFETIGITDGVADGGIIITDDIDFLSLLQQFCRFYPTWDLLQTDKLRLVDRGAVVTPDITLDKRMLIEDVTVTRQGEDTRRKDIELTTIDPDADYTLVPFATNRPRAPISVSNSVGKDNAYLPVIMDSSTRAAVATFANYYEENSRRSVSFKVMFRGFEVEPGDRVRLSDIDGNFRTETFKLKETSHGANYTVECIAQPILDCEISRSATWDPATVAAVTLSGGNLIATNTGTTSWDQGARVANADAQGTGKYYFEYTITNLAATGVNVDTTWGIAMTSANYSGLPNAVNAFLMNQVGLMFSNYASYGTFGQRASGDVIGVAVDFTNQKIWFRIAPLGDWNAVPAADPATNAFGFTTAGLSGAVAPIVGFGGFVGVAGNIITANFGGMAFSGAVPAGFTSGWPL